MKYVIIFLVVVFIVAGLAFSISKSIKGKITFSDIVKWTPLYIEPNNAPSASSNAKNTAINAGSIAKEQSNASEEKQTPQPVPPQGFSVNDLSPYYKKVIISGFVSPSYNTPLRGSFTIYFSGTSNSTVDITGWKVRGNRAGEVYIPQAAEDFTLSGWAPYSNIVLRSGDYVNVYSSRSSVDKNFRLNKCIGYLNNLYTFNPALPMSCPTFDRTQLITFSGACQTFLEGMGACQEPTAYQKNIFSGPLDVPCRAFLDTLNYGGCYRAHRADQDFFSREWRVWLNSELPFDTQHDRLILYDRNNKIVNEYIY